LLEQQQMESSEERLSPSEKRTLQHLVEGERHASELDWVALQRLKRLGLAEVRGAGVSITQDGLRLLQRLQS
jgi:hypothetical protein